MSLISKATGIAASQVAKYTGQALKVTKDVYGMPVTTYLKTGTKVAHNIDGAGMKSIELGKGNPLRSELGIQNLVSYPKDSFFGGKTGIITVQGEGADPCKFLTFEPKEFGDFIKMLKEMKNAVIK